MVLVVDAAHVAETLSVLSAHGESGACAIGTIYERSSPDEPQVVVENTAGWFA